MIMAELFPTDPKRIRERIRRYERALKKELEAGYGGDGYGKRYLLGPLYMLIDLKSEKTRWVQGMRRCAGWGPTTWGRWSTPGAPL